MFTKWNISIIPFLNHKVIETHEKYGTSLNYVRSSEVGEPVPGMIPAGNAASRSLIASSNLRRPASRAATTFSTEAGESAASTARTCAASLSARPERRTSSWPSFSGSFAWRSTSDRSRSARRDSSSGERRDSFRTISSDVRTFTFASSFATAVPSGILSRRCASSLEASERCSRVSCSRIASHACTSLSKRSRPKGRKATFVLSVR